MKHSQVSWGCRIRRLHLYILATHPQTCVLDMSEGRLIVAEYPGPGVTVTDTVLSMDQMEIFNYFLF